MPTQRHTFTLRYGERYRFNFPRAPGSSFATFLGYVTHPGGAPWIALRHDATPDKGGEVKFYNLACLNTLVPESDPTRISESEMEMES